MVGPADVGHAAEAWLCRLPADARRFRVSDPRLAAALEMGGAELVEGAPDVEIGARADELRGDAGVAVVSLGRPGWASGSLLARVAERARANARVRVQARAARRALGRLGYPLTEVVMWDVAEHLPACALVFGRREPAGPTILAAIGVEPRRLAARGGPMLAFSDRGLLRVAVGPGRRQLRGQVEALAALHALEAPEVVGSRVPWPIESGRAGLAEWTLEPLLPGASPADPPWADCLDFLVALHSVGGAPVAPLSGAAEIVAGASGVAGVRDLGERLDAELADLPRGFGHGDFFAENLLVEGGRLSGVVDWDSAGPGRLPLLDLMHLVLTARHRPSAHGWGQAVVGELLPLARAGGDDVVRDHCTRVGMEPDPQVLERLVAAYWLDRAASQLGTHAEHWEDREWIRSNLALVAAAFGCV